MARVCGAVVCVGIVLACAAAATAQTASGTIRGVVHDPQGAAVKAAAVEVVVRSTGVTRHVTSDADGTFVVPEPASGRSGHDGHRGGLWREPAHWRGRRSGADRVRGRRPACCAGARVGHRRGRFRPRRRRHDAVGCRCGDSRSVDRRAAAQRPQLPRARVARAGQRAGAELRSDQDQQRRDLFGRAARARRQHHDRRRRTTTTTSWAVRCTTSRRTPCRSSRSRRTASRPSRAARRSSAINVVTRIGLRRRCGGSHSFFLRDDALQGLPATFDRSLRANAALRPPAVRGDARRPARARQGVVVRRGRVSQPGRRRCWSGERDVAARTIRRTLAAGAARRLARDGAGRLEAAADRTRSWLPLPIERRGRHRGQHARPRDRLGLPAAGERQPLSVGPRHLDAHLVADRREHVSASASATSATRSTPVTARPAADVPEHPGRRVFRVPQATDADAVPVLRRGDDGAGRATRCGSAASRSA